MEDSKATLRRDTKYPPFVRWYDVYVAGRHRGFVVSDSGSKWRSWLNGTAEETAHSVLFGKVITKSATPNSLLGEYRTRRQAVAAICNYHEGNLT